MRIGIVWTVVAAGALAAPVQAQDRWERGDQEWCDREWGNSDRDRFCEVRTVTMPGVAKLDVDGGANGGVEVEAWDGDRIEVQARVWANARSQDRAEEIANAIDVLVDGGRVRAEGPRTGHREGWGVSFRLRVPRTIDLDLRTTNGGIDVAEVSGDIDFHATNGGVKLVGVNGTVRGRTTNGGLHVELAGDHWTGSGMDVETTNGGITLLVPETYSAELDARTTNGGIDVDFPVRVQGRIGRELHATLGQGGPSIKATTTNGGVRIRRR